MEWLCDAKKGAFQRKYRHMVSMKTAFTALTEFMIKLAISAGLNTFPNLVLTSSGKKCQRMLSMTGKLQ